MYNIIGISVPFGLQSRSSSTKLTTTIYNNRDEVITLYWVNYSGAAVNYGTIQTNRGLILSTYGTHPWLVADAYENAIAAFIPYTSDLKITVE